MLVVILLVTCKLACFFVFLISSSYLRVALVVQRKVERATAAKTGRIGVKRRDLVPKYCTPEKCDALVQKLRQKNLWAWDEDWPEDEEDCKCKHSTLVCGFVLFVKSLFEQSRL